MGISTLIEWTDSSTNPTSGCDGCELWIRGKVEKCYAGKIHERFAPSKAYPGPFEQIDLHPGRMAQAAKWPSLRGKDRPDKPWLNGMPRIIFIGDMGDLFSKGVPFEYIRDEVIAHIASKDGSRHLWMILTKQPKRLAEFAKWLENDQRIQWPSNILSGTSITTKSTRSRITDLMSVPGDLFLSVEPMVESVSLEAWYELPDQIVKPFSRPIEYLPVNKPKLVICGGESADTADKARPFNLQWARKLRDECAKYGAKYFLKQLGSNAWEDHVNQYVTKHHKGGDWNEWPEDIRRREFPR